MAIRTSRRRFLGTSLAAGATLSSGVWSQLSAAESKSPNEKLRIACIGVKNRASSNVSGVKHENIVAICDIDDNYLAEVGKKFPKAKQYNDFRKLLDDHKSIDAVVVSTPDHMHAPASLWAMQLGKHCYCEKPLTHTVSEARLVAKTAKQYGVATQMGTQIHAGNNYRRVVEIIQAGVIGQVKKVDVWVGKGWGGGERPTETPPVPENIHWDLWLGPAPERPYHSTYLPKNWRRWWDFGGGTMADMACHYMDLPFWALKLRHPTTIEAEGKPVHPETCPTGLTVRYQFPKRDGLSPVKLTWHDGDQVPASIAGHETKKSGVLFQGEKGQMYANYSGYQLFPNDQFQGFEPPAPTIPDSLGHYIEWIKACKEGTPTTCNFDYSGALTEAVLLGNVAYRTGQKLQWNARQLKATNCPEADALIERPYRKGWTL